MRGRRARTVLRGRGRSNASPLPDAIGSRPRVHVSADGTGVVGHAGARLLADLADATGLTSAYSTALGPLRPRGTGHDPGRVAVDLAVTLANGGETITDLAALRDQGEVFGPVASTPTAWRLLADLDERVLARLRSARSRARETPWLQAAETNGGIPTAWTAGRELPGLVLDIDATLITCHSEKLLGAVRRVNGAGSGTAFRARQRVTCAPCVPDPAAIAQTVPGQA
jgi:DDE family transposase